MGRALCTAFDAWCFVGCFDSKLLGHEELEWLDWHATAIPSRIYPFLSDQGSQTGLGSTSSV